MPSRFRRQRKRLTRQTASAALVVTGLALTCATTCLILIGSPPTVRIDEIWVHAHRAELRIFFPAVLVAAAATIIAVSTARKRIFLLGAWMLFLVLSSVLWERLVICTRVAIEQI